LGAGDAAEIERLLASCPPPDIARVSWRDYGEVIVCESDEEMLIVANRRPPSMSR
jgi:sulfopropanediol 3-dehydrogenase